MTTAPWSSLLDQFEEYLQRYAANLGLLPAALGALLLRTTMVVRVVLSFREFLASVDACLRVCVGYSPPPITWSISTGSEPGSRRLSGTKYGGTCDEGARGSPPR